MALIFKNYKQTKTKHEDLFEIKILEGEDVFVELPLAVAEFGVEYSEPVIFGDSQGVPRIFEAKDLLKSTKLFHFKEGAEDVETKQRAVIECDFKDPDKKITARLPINTPVEDLIFIDGQILLAEKQPQ